MYDTLRKEIKRRLKNFRKIHADAKTQGVDATAYASSMVCEQLEHILSFIATLKSEQNRENMYEGIRAKIVELKAKNEVAVEEALQHKFDIACGYNMALDDLSEFLNTPEES